LKKLYFNDFVVIASDEKKLFVLI